MLVTGTILQNRYEVIKPIGQGGMGAVYMARDKRLGNTVALKETFFLDTILLAAFEREAKLLAGLRHAALPKVIDHFADTNGQFLVMEYITGDDLQELLQEGSNPPPVDKVLQWADQLLDALEYLHSQQPPIIHRDIKPQNLKLTSRNQIVLLDFGLAKGTALELTHTGSSSSIFGYTPSYAPLEQAQGSGTDPQSDIYSLAATLYHLLTGKKPADAVARASCILNGEPDPLSSAIEINPRIPAGLSEVIMRSMALKRDHRPLSAAEMRRILRDSVHSTRDNLAVNAKTQPPGAEINRSSYPTKGSSTQIFASVPTPPANSAAASSYATRVSMTGVRPPMRAQVAEKSLNRARQVTAAQRRSGTVEIREDGSSSLSKVIVACIALVLTVVIVIYAFKPDLKSSTTNATPTNIQKTEQAAGSEQSDENRKTAAEVPGGANLRSEPFAPIEQPTKEEQPPDPVDKDQAKSVEGGQGSEQGESRQGIERANTVREQEAAEATQSQPPRRPEEVDRAEPRRPMPPPNHLHRPPPFPPPGHMPPPGRRRP